MKRLGVFLLPPGWDASPSQGYPPALNSPVPICTPGWREALWELSVLPKNTTQCPQPGLEPGPRDPESSTLTMRPPQLLVVKDRFIWHHNKARSIKKSFSERKIDCFECLHLLNINPSTPKNDLIDFTLSRRSYSSKGDPLGVKGLRVVVAQVSQKPLSLSFE